ncbi:UDP-N-acetylglucosamine 2-epimerase (hydrolyzing) [Enterobacter ludwigii]|uniref:Polysialic acid biosynthesis protein P7 n=1 Tax=Enterobacter cloacae TaxID=550 RepID=A0A6B9XSU7_ENTCL|nr:MULTISPECIES: UDP-N-acetylglucosamine 2-epimerase [Enterobacter cloacae complex]QHR93116.1 Polysialic acid biosynthesis protein P7 [Enterobacter cloacae]EUM09699.1 UDP-N-acetyl-D-glucosamine 2-epimerase, UDP-hydrolysing [Enterobacter sp. BIDMC 30]MBX9043624.1 UDP-N-acetylglucosamine 2-epimerase (hydrolyzing) [Enterobacter ludwigii]MBX9080451.1 UDP-N-acetylglucosamine 2-epimerase (hydrolyzing) [Enterobacter ludwigii]MCU2397760.1 UDP-N-acetylglucosamine 2-epimerase [Enterobacter ludwigii]
MKKKILYVTGSRAEYGIMKRLLLALRDDEDIELTIVATGMHCDEKYGLTYKNIENDGLVVNKLININIISSTNADVISAMSVCQEEFGLYFQDNKFDAVMILGDRYEIFSVAVAAAMHNMPIIHLHGGEKTLGNYDEFIRHAITKMARLHLASTEEYRNRIIQMGEHPESVINVGALGAENALSMNLPSKVELEENFGSLNRPYFVVVFHPETLNSVSPGYQVTQLLNALQKFSNNYDYIFIGSNSDTGSEEIMAKITAFCHSTHSRIFTSVKPEDYLALNKYSQGLIGNSSSGLIEIPSLHIPTINIGDRQKGRVRGESVIDCICNTEEIIQAINASQGSDFLEKIKTAKNPYYKNDVLKAALTVIKDFMRNQSSEYKDFYDL